MARSNVKLHGPLGRLSCNRRPRFFAWVAALIFLTGLVTFYSPGYYSIKVVGRAMSTVSLYTYSSLAKFNTTLAKITTTTTTTAATTAFPPVSTTVGTRGYLLETSPIFSAETFNAMAGLYQLTRVDCSSLFSLQHSKQSVLAIALARSIAKEEKKMLQDASGSQANLSRDIPQPRELTRLPVEWIRNATKDCEWYKRIRGYIMSPLTLEEENFPIAYSLVVYKDLEMVERLLRMIYRPQNRYCIHVDSSSSQEYFSTVQAIAACFPDNVFMSSRRIKVQWGTFSVLTPEIICMQDLWDMDQNKLASPSRSTAATGNCQDGDIAKVKRKKWKYFINLTGQEFPLRTNHELVKILKAYKGANNGDGTRRGDFAYRWKTRPPHGIQVFKGGVHTLLNRATVDFILHNDTAKDFIKWLQTTTIPDETLFSSIIYNPQLNIPGTYNGIKPETVPYLTRYKMWWGANCSNHHTVRSVCILSTGDLHRLHAAPHMFANKFYLDEDRVVIGCLEEKLFNDTRDEYLGRKSFDTSFYAKQDFVKNQVRHGKPSLISGGYR